MGKKKKRVLKEARTFGKRIRLVCGGVSHTLPKKGSQTMRENEKDCCGGRINDSRRAKVEKKDGS